MSILIVDSSEDVSRELESVLLDFDPRHARRLAKAPDEALSIGEAFQPDVIIYDLPLVGPTDAQVIAQLKRILPDTRIIAISLFEHYRETALSAGADQFILKTASRSSFLAALDQQSSALKHHTDLPNGSR